MNDYPKLDATQMNKLQQKVANMESGDEGAVPGKNLGSSGTPKDVLLQPENIFPEQQQKNIKNEIKRLEEELRGFSQDTPQASADPTFRDSYGDETYYIRNVFGTHVLLEIISSSERNAGITIKIENGSSIDLTESANLEDIRRCRDLKSLLRTQKLVRLTEQQYLEDLRVMTENKKKIAMLKQQEALRNMIQPQQAPDLMPHERTMVSPFQNSNSIRPVIQSKIGKLALRTDKDPENRKLAMTNLEFIEWVHSERLTHAEIGYIMEQPAVSSDHDIRAALLEKKSHTPAE